VILEKKEAVIKYSPTEISPPIIAEKVNINDHCVYSSHPLIKPLPDADKILLNCPPQERPSLLYGHFFIAEVLVIKSYNSRYRSVSSNYTGLNKLSVNKIQPNPAVEP
jgi:hypothetical protein